MAILWGVVVGSSLFSTELTPNVGRFWRSRPISHHSWFLCKYLIGLAAVLVVLDGFTILVSWQAQSQILSSRHDMMGMSRSYVACMPLLHALLYSMAVLGTCLFRKPVLGGMLAILGFAVLNIFIDLFPATKPYNPVNVFNQILAEERGLSNPERIGHFDLTQHGYPLVFGMMFLAIIILVLISSHLTKPLQGRFHST